MTNYVITAYLDTRRSKTGRTKKDGREPQGIGTDARTPSPKEKRNETYPLKIRVYSNYATRFYPTGIDLTEEQFQQSYLSERPRGEENKALKLRIESLVGRANDVAISLRKFDFSRFEKLLLRPSSAAGNVFYHYNEVVGQLKSEERVGTASSYELSARSLKLFLKDRKKDGERLPFEEVTPRFLQEYEKWMVGQGKELTTVGIYLRPLRAIFNTAIQEGEIDKEFYPFSRSKYQIPAGSNVKKALSKADLKRLFNQEVPEGSSMEKARAFWFFSYQCNGINIRDICELKYKNIGNDSITFIRTKTKKTTKANQKPIVAPITSYVLEVINKYGNVRTSSETYVFPVFADNLTAEKKLRAAQAFTRFINQHMKKLAKLAGVDTDISTYYARHSFTTVSVQNGASLEFIQESLGHTSISTTMNYWKGFEENVKKDNANKLMDFE